MVHYITFLIDKIIHYNIYINALSNNNMYIQINYINMHLKKEQARKNIIIYRKKEVFNERLCIGYS